MGKKNYSKILSRVFVDNNENVDEDTASRLIVEAAKQIRAIKEEKKEDPQLAAAQQLVKDLSSAYSAAIKNEQAKIEFLLEKIAEIEDGSVNPSSGANAS
jgi:rubrerythrin